MKFNTWYLIAAVPFALLFARGEYGPQLLVLGLTLSVFFGTLSLKRPAADATTTHPGHG